MIVHCLVFDGFSDWEPAFVLPELRKKSIEIKVCGFSKNIVESSGGLRVLPDVDIFNLQTSEIKVLIIPGGTLWEKEVSIEFLELIKKLYLSNSLIAAICGATIPLAQAGLLESIKHTSNDLNYLKKMAPSYKGDHNYSTVLAIRDKNIITASGVGAIEFAKTLLIALSIYDEDKALNWFNLFKHGKWTGPF